MQVYSSAHLQPCRNGVAWPQPARTREHAARAVLAPDVRHLGVILHEEVEVLVRNIHLRTCEQFTT